MAEGPEAETMVTTLKRLRHVTLSPAAARRDGRRGADALVVFTPVQKSIFGSAEPPRPLIVKHQKNVELR